MFVNLFASLPCLPVVVVELPKAPDTCDPEGSEIMLTKRIVVIGEVVEAFDCFIEPEDTEWPSGYEVSGAGCYHDLAEFGTLACAEVAVELLDLVGLRGLLDQAGEDDHRDHGIGAAVFAPSFGLVGFVFPDPVVSHADRVETQSVAASSSTSSMVS